MHVLPPAEAWLSSHGHRTLRIPRFDADDQIRRDGRARGMVGQARRAARTSGCSEKESSVGSWQLAEVSRPSAPCRSASHFGRPCGASIPPARTAATDAAGPGGTSQSPWRWAWLRGRRRTTPFPEPQGVPPMIACEVQSRRFGSVPLVAHTSCGLGLWYLAGFIFLFETIGYAHS